MTYTVFYMNPDATPDCCDIVRECLPDRWRLLTPSHRTDFTSELAEADFVIVATESIREYHIARAPKLKMIQHQGVGYERIDLEACRRRRIPVGLTPEGTSEGVAEHTLLLILSVCKQLVRAANGVARGEWMQWSLRSESFELKGKTVGLIGFGRIGREVARRASAFDARVVYYDPFCEEDPPEAETRSMKSLELLLAASDIVSLHLPYTKESHQMINVDTLAMMKPGAILINTARGGLVDEAALIAALESGRLHGAGLDVFAHEPLSAEHPLLGHPRVVVTPHIAAGTRDALLAKMQAAFTNLQRFVHRQPIRNLVPELSELQIAREKGD